MQLNLSDFSLHLPTFHVDRILLMIFVDNEDKEIGRTVEIH
jgi:hypothetical protein